MFYNSSVSLCRCFTGKVLHGFKVYIGMGFIILVWVWTRALLYKYGSGEGFTVLVWVQGGLYCTVVWV